MPTNVTVFTLALSSLLAVAACNGAPPTAVAEPSPVPADAAPSVSVAPPEASDAAPPAAGGHAATPSAEAAALLAQAETCSKDPACDQAKADALYRDADDAGARVDCFRFYYGIGVTKDLPRARACFERQVAADPGCGGQSSSLDRATLATMLLDGQGGPADPARVMGAFAGCYKDATVQGIEEQLHKRTLPSPLDFCDAIGGTTITIGACHQIEARRIEDRQRRLDRDVLGKLDPEGKQLAARARDLHRKFADTEGEAGSDWYRGGSIRSNAWLRRQNELEGQRTARLAHLFEYALTPGADAAEADKDMEKAFAAALDGDAEHKRLFDESRRAWTAYRDAEIALYAHTLGDKLGKRAVASDVRAMLTRAYAKELEDAVRP